MDTPFTVHNQDENAMVSLLSFGEMGQLAAHCLKLQVYKMLLILTTKKNYLRRLICYM